MSAIVTTDFLSALLTNFRAIFKEAFQGEKPKYQPLVASFKSDAERESYNWLGALPAVTEWLDERIVQGLRSESYEIVNRNYQLAISVDRNTLEDEKYGLIAPRIRQMAKRVANHPNKLIFQLLNAGVTTKTYDGEVFFKADRKIGDSGIINNIAAGAYAADAAKVRTGIDKAIQQMMEFKDDQGQPMELIPDTVICNPKKYLLIMEALKPTAQAVSRVEADIIKNVIATGYLTSGATAGHDYIVCCTSAGELKPALLQMRKLPEFVALDKPDSRDVFMRRLLYYGTDSRYGCALLEPRTAVLVDCSD